MPNSGAPARSRSSLSLALLYYTSAAYYAFWWLATAAMFIWKDYVLPYPDNNLGAEVALLFIFVPVEATRLFFGIKGNLTEQKQPMLVSIIFSVPSALAFLFYVLWQTYVLRAEFYIGIVAILLLALEVVLGVLTMLAFARQAAFR